MPGRREKEFRIERAKLRAGRGEEASRGGRKTSSVMEEKMPRYKTTMNMRRRKKGGLRSKN